MAKYYFNDSEFGDIYIHTRSSSVKIIAKWKDNHIFITAPEGVTEAHYRQFIEKNREWFRNNRPSTECPYTSSDRWECFNGYTIILEPYDNDTHLRQDVNEERKEVVIKFPQHILSSPNSKKVLLQALTFGAQVVASMGLLHYAHDVAQELGVGIRSLTLGTGAKRMGSCSSDRDITLSHYLALYPKHLVRYVICHELGHCTHHDHSPQFHALVNRYCNGKEAQLDAEFKSLHPLAKYS